MYNDTVKKIYAEREKERVRDMVSWSVHRLARTVRTAGRKWIKDDESRRIL